MFGWGRNQQPPGTPPRARNPGQEDESPLVQRVRRMNEAAAPSRNAQRGVLHPSPSPISKSAVKRGSAAHGVRRANTSHRSLLAPNLITRATDVAWLTGMNDHHGQRNVKELSEEDTIVAGAKIVYFVTNDFNPQDLRALTSKLTPLKEDGLLWREATAEFGSRKSKWQNGVISYIEATVVKLMDAWSQDATNRGREFKDLPEVDRLVIWMDEYNHDSHSIAQEWWKPVGGSLDWHAIFDMPDDASDDAKARVARVQRMLRNKWIFACDQVCQFSILTAAVPLAGFFENQEAAHEMSSKQHLKNWKGFAMHPRYRGVMAAFADVPVHSEYANGRMSVASANGTNPNQDHYVNLCWD
ncbi:hypothetical protein E8E13_010589 [Curvularia kusanoi]|uniref:Uncharacterized protein n=1 Tax=Curvularia kusanoi TaxID=90978 RepID=A0A9P4TKF4_CURKU|nr:hypothetical protein E8E13_010589 [Curvularia kusanoi]